MTTLTHEQIQQAIADHPRRAEIEQLLAGWTDVEDHPDKTHQHERAAGHGETFAHDSIAEFGGQPLDQLADNGLYAVHRLAHWEHGQQYSSTDTSWAGLPTHPRQGPADHVPAMGHAGQSIDADGDSPTDRPWDTLFDADRLAARNAKLVKAADKAALPYLFDTSNRRRALKTRRSINSARAAAGLPPLD